MRSLLDKRKAKTESRNNYFNKRKGGTNIVPPFLRLKQPSIYNNFYDLPELFDSFYPNPSERFKAGTVRLNRFFQHIFYYLAAELFL